jgi:hypothetical protein
MKSTQNNSLFKGLTVLALSSIGLNAQTQTRPTPPVKAVPWETQKQKNAFTAGLFKGGNGLFGVEYERMLYKNISAKIGGGATWKFPNGSEGTLSYNMGFNYRFAPYVSSHAVGVEYAKMFIGLPDYGLSSIGAFYNGRWFDILDASLGLAYAMETGTKMPTKLVKTGDFLITISVGVYLPFRTE